jgi:tetratricopeptide (TPR) repeat protein
MREARAAATLRHPGIVPVYDVAVCDGIEFLVSEFVAGETLESRISSARPSPRAAALWLAYVAEAVDHAHQRGVVHRDLKPSNILLDESDQPRLLDFGLARCEAPGNTLTLQGDLLGTPAYMSPEQAGGDAHAVDGRSDVWSLGVILYELLTGERPFRGSSRMVLRQVLEDEPRAPKSVNDDIPRDLETICLKAMAKEPDNRYGSAGLLAEDLRRFLRGEPVHAQPLGPVSKLARWCRRKPVHASLAAALLLVTAGGFSAVVAAWRDAVTHRNKAEQHLGESRRQFTRAEQNFHDARALVSEFVELSDSPLFAPRALRPARKKLLQTCLRFYESFLKQHGEDRDLRSEVATCLFEYAYAKEQLSADPSAVLEEARGHYRDAEHLWTQLIQEEPENAGYLLGLARNQRFFGQLYWRVEQPDTAGLYFAEARDILEPLGDPPDPDVCYQLAEAYRWIGIVHKRRDRLPEAQNAFEQAVRLWDAHEKGRALSEIAQRSRCMSASNLAVVTERLGDKRSARQANESVLRWTEALRRRWPEDPGIPHARAQSLYAIGKLDEELNITENLLAHYSEAADLFQIVLKHDPGNSATHLEVGNCAQRLGSQLAASNRLEEAIAAYRPGLESRKILRDLDPTSLSRQRSFAETCASLGDVLERAGRKEDALRVYLQVIDPNPATLVGSRRHAESLRILAEYYKQVASALSRLDRADSAETLLKQVDPLEIELGRLVP